MTRIEKLRAGFLSRTRREKMLAAMFLLVLVAIWLFLLVGRARAFTPELRSVRAKAAEDARWFEIEPGVQQRYEAALARLSRTDLPTGAQAYALVDQIVRRSGYEFRMDPPQPTRREQITFHPINVRVSKAAFDKLDALFREITTALPTVNLDEITIGSDRSNPRLLDAQFKFVAIEIHP